MSALAEARRAVKFASLAVDPRVGDGVFLPWASPVPYQAEARAVCGHGQDHAAPDPGCECGFYAAHDLRSLLDLLRPTIHDIAGSAMLDVELGGLELAGPRGARSAEQRVLGAEVIRWCPDCGEDDTARRGPARLYGTGTMVAGRTMHALVTRCDAHLGSAALQTYSLADVAGLLRTELTWATDEVVGRVLDARRAALTRGQLRGPLLPTRRIGQLRMGQVGFTVVDSLRLDSDGRLWVDVDAPASQRRHGCAVVAIHRRVDLHLELVVRPAVAARLDAALTRRRLPALGRREHPLRHVDGLRHLPGLAARWSR